MCFSKNDRGGFTLAELMISLVLGALIIGVVLNFVTGQTRLTSMQSGRQEVQQNARGALEMVASDLRGAIGAGIVLANADEIEVALPRRWGVVCSQPAANSTVVVFPNLPSQPLPTGVDAGLLLRQGNGAWQPALPARATVNAATLVNVNVACAGLSATGNVVAYQLDGAGHPAVPAGTTAALYQLVRYDVGVSRGERWIQRSNGMTAAGAYVMQPLAGPVDQEAGGISFSYFTVTPPTPVAAPGAAVAAAQLSQVRLRVRMKSRQTGRDSQVEFDSATVQLRNDN